MGPEAHLALLRRFEPIVRYTHGERFFPLDVAPYVRHCSLWVQRPNEEALCLVPHGQMTLDRLAEPRPDAFGAVYYLKFTNPLNVAELAAFNLRRRDGFHVGRGRLARVGYLSRFLDALFSLSLLARGRVPGDNAAAAALAYQRLAADDRGLAAPRYHGRVVRQEGWIVLQYWFFYAYNNWRSGYSGANDHEADWELICVYLSEGGDGAVQPEWVAYASHDYAGDDLRRHWDDPELLRSGDHPIVFAGAGSHGSYYVAGEYLTELEVPLFRPLIAVTDRLQAFWHETLRQYRVETGQPEAERASNLFRVPFVDYARGDGRAIGPGQPTCWATPHLLHDDLPWATHYRGLWGLFARDPFSGEDAPAGPMYNRDGSVRRAWYDPVGWAGLDKVPPLPHALDVVRARQADLAARQTSLRDEIEEKSRTLRELGVEAAAVQRQPHLRTLFEAHQQRILLLSEEVDALRAEQAANEGLLASLEGYAARLRAGERGPLRDHIRRPHRPASAAYLRATFLAETWAAASVGLTLIGFVALVLFARHYLLFGLLGILTLFIFIEATFRGRLINLVTTVTVGLAGLASLVLLYEFFWPIVILIVFLVGGYLLLENLRELRR